MLYGNTGIKNKLFESCDRNRSLYRYTAGSDHALISVDADFGESEEFEKRTGKKQEK